MLRCLAVIWVLSCAAGVAAAAEDLEFRAPASADAAATAAAMRSLAVRALPVYENPDRAQFLTNLSALQMVAGEYAAADATRQSLHELRVEEKTAREVDEALIYDLYARARALVAKSKSPLSFDQAFARVFHETVSPLNDLDAYTVTEWLATPLPVFEGNLQRELDRLRGKDRISLSEAVDLAWTYLSFEAFQSFSPVVGPLIAADDRSRYIIDDGVRIQTRDRAMVSAVVIRPRDAPARLPALLEFTIHVDPHNDARECAAHGYASVIAYARGTAGSSAALAPYEHDGDDARAVIEWIAEQPWSDGRVGMYGSGYSAFAAWAAAKQPPPALKALAASSAAAPGVDAPSRDRIEGMSDALYRRWLEHPGFDRFWQKRLPYGRDFARIGLPVLTTTGYYDEEETGSLYYFLEQAHFDPSAAQTLLIGPYDSDTMERGPLPVLGGYSVDEAAIIDLRELRFRWFDHVLKAAPAPALLSARVNFEVMGANAWRHAGSLEDMANGAVRLYLDPARVAGHYQLTGHEPSGGDFVEQPADSAGPGAAGSAITAVMARTLPVEAGAVFVSGPLHRPLEVSGLISGALVYAASGRGLALDVRVYELRSDGEYLELFAPPDALCADCAPGSAPHPLSATARRRTLEFRGDRLTSAELQTGSRIVVVLGASQPPSAQKPSAAGKRAIAGAIAGASVSASASASRRGAARPAASPEVRWYTGSFVELPVWR